MDRIGIEAWVDAGALMLGLPVTPENRPQVLANLERLALIAARLDAVALEPETEPLPVFVR
jgi:hypothetical protein